VVKSLVDASQSVGLIRKLHRVKWLPTKNSSKRQPCSRDDDEDELHWWSMVFYRDTRARDSVHVATRRVRRRAAAVEVFLTPPPPVMTEPL